MNKTFIWLFLLFVIIGIIFVSADNSDDKMEDGGSDDSREKITTRENGQRIEIERKIKIDEQGNREIEIKKKIIDAQGKEREVKVKIEVDVENGEIKRKIKIEDGNATFEAETELEIEETIENNKSIIRVNKSNGIKSEIKIMPDRASEIAIEQLKSLNFSIELKEVGNKIIYEIETNKSGRFFGIIKTKVKIKAEIDPETGEIIRIKKPVKAFFTFGEDSDQIPFGEKVTLCHIPRGNIEAKHTITVGRPAAAAHLRHSDTIGACETTPGNNNTGNQTSPGNNTGTNTTINNTNTNTTVNNTETNQTNNSQIQVNVSLNVSANL
ncbi:MAG: PepSY domain-containing protein [Nanoarchaeota archaeon]